MEKSVGTKVVGNCFLFKKISIWTKKELFLFLLMLQRRQNSKFWHFWAANRQKCIKWTNSFSILFLLIYVLIKNRAMQDLKISPKIYVIPPTPTI